MRVSTLYMKRRKGCTSLLTIRSSVLPQMEASLSPVPTSWVTISPYISRPTSFIHSVRPEPFRAKKWTVLALERKEEEENR